VHVLKHVLSAVGRTISSIEDPAILSSIPQWWKLNQGRYKLLLEVVLRLLCIPATSAPSERVFSVAGLTIAKDRARLAPQTANELIILHDAIPAIRKYYVQSRDGY
jgi:hypothetical protein